MPYTSQGFMTHADMAEVLCDMDMGETTVDAEDLTCGCASTEGSMANCDVHGYEATGLLLVVWEQLRGGCPACGQDLGQHESFTVTDAGGTIVACLLWSGEAHTVAKKSAYDRY